MKKAEDIKIGISGIRGIIGKTLTPKIALNFTRAFCTLINNGKVAVGKDSRFSGEFLKRAVLSGLLYSGITPVDIGVVATPTLQNYVKEKKLAGGIIITASHNPEEWNGLKFIDQNGLFISPFSALHMIDLYHQRNFSSPKKNIFPRITTGHDAFRLHKERILKIIDTQNIKKKAFKVLADPGGGVGSLYDKEFLEEFNCHVSLINNTIQNKFPRDPEPIPQNLQKISETIFKGDYDLGFAQDSDADCLVTMDEHGNILNTDLSLAISIWGYLINQKPPGNVVINLSTSKTVTYIIKKLGFNPVYSPVGEVNVVEKMHETNAIAGGEGNGGVIIPAVHYCRDSFTSMALVLNLLTKTGKPLSTLIKKLPQWEIIKKKIPCSMSKAQQIVTRLSQEYSQANKSDGLKIEKHNYWFHIRASNTEPVLRLIAEGEKDLIKKHITKLLLKINNLK